MSKGTLASRTPATCYQKKKWDLLENCQKLSSQIVLKSLNLARIGRPDILWSVNKLARAVTKWTKACDKRFGAFDLIHSSYM